MHVYVVVCSSAHSAPSSINSMYIYNIHTHMSYMYVAYHHHIMHMSHIISYYVCIVGAHRAVCVHQPALALRAAMHARSCMYVQLHFPDQASMLLLHVHNILCSIVRSYRDSIDQNIARSCMLQHAAPSCMYIYARQTPARAHTVRNNSAGRHARQQNSALAVYVQASTR